MHAYFQSTLKHPVGPGDYLILAWPGTSLATVAGAIGSSLEHEDTVREVAYGYRQRRRNEKYASEDDSEAQCIQRHSRHAAPMVDGLAAKLCPHARTTFG